MNLAGNFHQEATDSVFLLFENLAFIKFQCFESTSSCSLVWFCCSNGLLSKHFWVMIIEIMVLKLFSYVFEEINEFNVAYVIRVPAIFFLGVWSVALLSFSAEQRKKKCFQLLKIMVTCTELILGVLRF